MSSIQSWMHSSISTDALPYLVVGLTTAVFGFFGARFTATAPLQASLNDAFRSLMEELQTQHAQDSVRILELEREVLRLRGENNQYIQVNRSATRLLEQRENHD